MQSRILACTALSFLVGCADATDEIGAASSAVDVTWTNVVGVDAVGNDLTKTDPGNSWNAGAASVEAIAANGYLEFTTAEANTTKSAGLSVGDTDQGFADIDFAIRLRANGSVGVYEAGVLRGSFGVYAPGDLFRIEVEGGVVSYRRNGATFYTSAVAPGAPLLVDTSLFTPGATINDVVLVSTSLTWQNVVGVSISGNDLTKTAGTGTWTAGASTVETLTGDGFVEFSTGEASTAKAAGLSSGDSGQSYTDIDFAIRLNANGVVTVYEGGVVRVGNAGTYMAGDVFRVEVAGGVVQYSKNGGAPFYASAIAPTFPLLVDTAFLTPGATVNDVTLTEAANACTAYDGAGAICDGSFTVNNAFDLAEIAGCANITGNLTIQAPGMTVIALPALERVGGTVTITGNTTLARLRLPQLKELGGMLTAQLAVPTDGFDLSRLRTSARIAIDLFDDDVDLALPCLETSNGDLSAQDLSGTVSTRARIHVPQLRAVFGSTAAHLTAPLLETLSGSVTAGDFVAPLLTSIGGGVGTSGIFDVPLLTTIGGGVSAPIDQPLVTSIGGALDYFDGTNLPALATAGAVTFRDPTSIALPSLVEVAGLITGGSSFCTLPTITAPVVDLPALELAGAIRLCWPALETVSLPVLERITGPTNAVRGLFIHPNNPTIPIDLPLLERVRGDVDIDTEANLPVLTFIRGRLTVRHPMTAPALDEVDGRVLLRANLSADALTLVTSLLIVNGATDVTLPALTSVDAFLSSNLALAVLDLPSLTTVAGTGAWRDAGDFRIERSAVAEISLPSLQFVQDELEIFNNDSMTVLTAPALTEIGPYLRIVGNADLPNCYATDIRDQLLANGWTGTADINGNNGTGTCP